MALAARSSHQAALSSRRSKKLNMIKDDGLDSNGIYRNIARDQASAHSVLGTPAVISWNYICQLIANSKQQKEVSLNIVDTIICSNSLLVAHIYTDVSTGRLKVSQNCNKIDAIIEKLIDVSKSSFLHQTYDFRSQELPVVAALTGGYASFIQLVDESNLRRVAKAGRVDAGVEMMTAYIHPKGGKNLKAGDNCSTICNFRYLFSLDKLAKPIERFIRLNISDGVAGSRNKELPSKISHVNKSMSRHISTLIRLIESCRFCRVVSLEADFVVDATESAWLVRVLNCNVANEPRVAVMSASESLHRRNKLNENLVRIHGIKNRDSEVKSDFSAHVLGSTQLENACKGDFCDFDVSVCMENALDLRNVSELNEHAFGSCSKHGQISNEFESKLVNQEQDAALKDLAGILDRSSQNTGFRCMHDMPYSLILLARKEKHLADAFLRRYIEGETNVQYMGLDGARLGKQYPGHFYRPVKVCTNCYIIYNKIREARSRSIESLRDKCRKTQLSEQFYPNDSALKCQNDDIYARACAAMRCVTKGDLAEIRSFTQPPPAVLMVVSAAMVMLRGSAIEWKVSKSILVNGDRFIAELQKYDPAKLTEKQRIEIERYVRNPYFRPEDILSSSKASAKLCAWVLGAYVIYSLQKGYQIDEKNDPLLNFRTVLPSLNRAYGKRTNGYLLRCAERTKPIAVDHENRSSGEAINRINHNRESTTKKDRALGKAKALCQQRKMSKLSQKESKTIVSTSLAKTLLCSDEITRIPYEIFGEEDATFSKMNFVVCHDLFDTIDMTKLMFLEVVKKHLGCQVLLFNLPGQAGTTFPFEDRKRTNRAPSSLGNLTGSKGWTLNNDFIAHRVHELLEHLNGTGEFLVSIRPFHFVGIGTGMPVVLSFCEKFGKEELFVNTLKSIISVNGFASIDPQLTAILHATLNVFRSFPANRPDLPVSYFTRFLFSNEYLNKVTRDLALNIYTAVINPITLEGRIRLCSGVLNNRDIKKAIAGFHVPIIAMQSNENIFVNKGNITSLIAGRNAQCFNASEWDNKVVETYIPATLRVPEGALVFNVNAGHAVLQECKRKVVKFFDILACPDADYMLAAVQCVKSSKNVENTSSCSKELLENDEKRSDRGGGSGEVAGSTRTICDESPAKAEIVSPEPSFCPHMTTSNDVNLHSDCIVNSGFKNTLAFGSKSECGNNANQATMMKDLLENCDRESFYTMSGIPQIDFSRFSAPDQAFVEKKRNTHDLRKDGTVLNEHEWQSMKSKDFLMERTTDSALLDTRGSRVSKQSTSGQLNYSTTGLNTLLPSPSTTLSNRTSHSEAYDSLSAYLDAGLPLELIPTELLVPTPTKEQKKLRRWQRDGRGREGQYVPPTPDDLLRDAVDELNFEKEREKKNIKEMRLFNIEKERVMENIQLEQESRRNELAATNEAMLIQIDSKILARERNRAQRDMQRRVDIDLAEDVLKKKKIIPKYVPPAGVAPPVRTMAPTFYRNPQDFSAGIPKKKLESVLDDMEGESATVKKMGAMRLEEFERVKEKMAQQQMEREKRLRSLEESERVKLFQRSACLIQRVLRGYCGRKRRNDFKCQLEFERRRASAVVWIQKLARGTNARVKAKIMRRQEVERVVLGSSAILVQRTWRGHRGRRFLHTVRRILAVVALQKVIRGFLGRRLATRKQQHLVLLRAYHLASVKIQSSWRTKMASDVLNQLKLQNHAATEIQRCVRGQKGRKKAAFNRDWLHAKPGGERLELGLKLIEDSKEEFEHHRKDINTLHRIQEKAEKQVNRMHQELKKSEEELYFLEDELQDLGDIKVPMCELQCGTSFEKEANPMDVKVREDMSPGECNKSKTGAIEVTGTKHVMQVRVERERKKQRVESELAIVMSEIEEKRSSLEHVEEMIADMEATRQRKDREFARLQRDLMKLLEDQKFELDELRGKGIELETATATSAAAAAAAARKAKKHEAQTTAMFHKHEDMLKFQFMSMSLNYFSSLNMLKEMRQMSSDTTTTAISASLQTASSAAAAASAAMMPGNKALKYTSHQSMRCDTKVKNIAENLSNNDKSSAVSIDLPGDIRTWSITDVSSWLQKLSLGIYATVFREASIDGEFLLDLREEDLKDILGIEHKLHRRKILLSLQRKLSEETKNKPNSDASSPKVDDVLINAPQTIKGIPPDVVFSQARHGRLKRLEESLDTGFDVNAEDEFGNSLMMIAVQNRHLKIADILLSRGALLNHVNSNGNSALHFAFAYDTTGELGEFLIENGANDTIENSFGCTPYDGIGGDISG